MHRQSLSSAAWTVRLLRADVATPPEFPRDEIAANVPGCVHTDMIRAGLIGDPNRDFNEDAIQWVGRCDWEYRCVFNADDALFESARIDLACDGLDTIATFVLNGQLIGHAANQFHPHRFDLRGALRRGENELVIDFRSPLVHIREEEARLGARPVNGDWDPYIFIRKMACNFGWDWGPKIATVGIDQEIGLKAWDIARIEQVRPLVRRAPDSEGRDAWTVDVIVDLERADESSRETITIEARLSDGETPIALATVDESPGSASAIAHLLVSDVRIWWPRGHGDAPLYQLEIELRASPPIRGGHSGRAISETASQIRPYAMTQESAGADGKSMILDRAARRIGFRTIQLDTSPDEIGERFVVRVNDKPIFCLGANWIPEGLFPADRSPARIRERLDQAAAANLNMIRVWGGGQYESEAYYDRCDELGLLVWQDFMFACACYPEEEPLRSQVEAEARFQIARLASHPSIVLWCGGNECIWAWQRWGFRERLAPGQSWGAGYWRDLLPRLVAELDPTRPYWPNTPWSGLEPPAEARGTPAAFADVLDPNRGTLHIWDRTVEGYRDLIPRFLAEFGHQSPPCYATLREALPAPVVVQVSLPAGPLVVQASLPADHLVSQASVPAGDPLAIDSPAMRHRQRAGGGNPVRYDQPLAEHFAPPQNFDDWLYLTQLLQARAIAIGLEWLRIHRDRCGGAMFWQLNDAWAGHSWSAIDVAGRRKPLWYAIRRACAPRLLTIQPIDGRPTLFGVNETEDLWKATICVRRIEFDGTTHAAEALSMTVPPWQVARIADLTDALGAPGNREAECLIADCEELRATSFFARDRELAYPEPFFDGRVERDGTALRITVSARTLARDIVIAADRVHPDAFIDEQLITLLPGETHTFAVDGIPESAALPGVDAWLSRPIFQCANRFGLRASDP